MKIKLGRLTFSPMPGLTIVTLICVAILLMLGTWQYKRLHWKTNLIIDIERAANAAPLTNLRQLNDMLKATKPLDFRRIELSGAYVLPTSEEARPYHLMKSDGKRYYWRIYQPYMDDNSMNGTELAYIATHEFLDADKDTPPPAMEGARPVIGYVRMVQPANKFIPKSSPETNRWFAFNGAPELQDWAQAVRGKTVATDYYIDLVFDVKSAGDLPVRIPDVPNNHLDYMLTWYSFVIILLVIYLILHKRSGRLTRERK